MVHHFPCLHRQDWLFVRVRWKYSCVSLQPTFNFNRGYIYIIGFSNSKGSPFLGLLPWRSPSLGYAKKGRVGSFSRRPSGHGGCSVPMNRWKNAGGSTDGHLPIARRVPYKRVFWLSWPSRSGARRTNLGCRYSWIWVSQILQKFTDGSLVPKGCYILKIKYSITTLRLQFIKRILWCRERRVVVKTGHTSSVIAADFKVTVWYVERFSWAVFGFFFFQKNLIVLIISRLYKN